MQTHPIKPITTVAVIAEGHVVLVKYAGMPDHQRDWFLPHDLLNLFEHPTDGAKRAILEQLGIRFDSPALKHIESFKGRDGTWHMSFHHLVNLPERVELKRSEALAAAEWVPLDQLPPREQVAHHGWALDTLEAIGVLGAR